MSESAAHGRRNDFSRSTVASSTGHPRKYTPSQDPGQKHNPQTAGVSYFPYGASLGDSNLAARSGHSVSITSRISSLIAVTLLKPSSLGSGCPEGRAS